MCSSDDDMTRRSGKDDPSERSAACRTPSLTRLDLLRVRREDLPRSFSDLDLRHTPRSRSSSRYGTYSDRLVSNKNRTRLADDEEKIYRDKKSKQADPYSISSSMKISDSKGAFETSTGKSGLNAWMGKKVSSPKVQRKVLL